MGYLYENTNDERFQHLCQSLFTIDFPTLQCLPVGQPDGGRDGLDPEADTVLQVKFKKIDEPENAEWMIAALEKEKPKIEKLISSGLHRYIIATNARGTAHLGGGRIDLVQQWLDSNLSIPAQTMWRDDIDRRLDRAPTNLKLKYSELLTLEDGLPIVLQQLWLPDQERQKDAIQAFVKMQYSADETVKFKQVGLSNDLLDLFIDVPVGLPQHYMDRLRKESRSLPNSVFRFIRDRNISLVLSNNGTAEFVRHTDGLRPRLRGPAIGAADLLLGDNSANRLTRTLLEGAPGQGKSTIAQYVCQVHRARFLNKTDTIARVPDDHLRSGLRIPVKVDLRDFALFLDGKSPFGPTSGDHSTRTLEVFLAQLISAKSGGINFTSHDVFLLFKQSPTLLFLDGLDEVANIDLRERLITSLGEAMTRLDEFDAQIVVTSRPSTFGKVPKLDQYDFQTLVLTKLDKTRIDDYADRWTIARNLEPAEREDVKSILADKLQQTHIMSLTTNAMQLTILLSLIHQVGHSLPDQRTDLYRRYIDLFFTREADKSTSVREHRHILIGFIQHLAWVLQAEAESSKGAGNISVEKLYAMARSYLGDNDYPPALADDLFSGGLERIFVLVERIEGLYEFEVQPLREFFCAEHLYATAPVGTYLDSAPHGDRAQRFEALASNPFWMNVARFYAGFYERGEIGALVLSLQELSASTDKCLSSHVRKVGLALLQDWVFSNKKFAQNQLIESIFDDFGMAIFAGSEAFETEGLALELECGQSTLRKVLFDKVRAQTTDDSNGIYTGPLRVNGGANCSSDFVPLVESETGRHRTHRLRQMFRSGAARTLDATELRTLVEGDNRPRWQQAERRSFLLTDDYIACLRCPSLIDAFIQDVLDGIAPPLSFSYNNLALFAEYLTLPNATDEHFQGDMSRYQYLSWPAKIEDEHLPSAVTSFLESVELKEPGRFATRRRVVIEHAEQIFGQCWAVAASAVHLAGVREARKPEVSSERLFDRSTSISDRARMARLRRGGTKWWVAQLSDAANTLDRMFWAALALVWTSPDNLLALSAEINEVLDALTEDEFAALRRTVAGIGLQRQMRSDRARLGSLSVESFSVRSGLVVTDAFQGTGISLGYSQEQSESAVLRDKIRYEEALFEVMDFPSWADHPAVIDWLRRLQSIRLDGYPLPMNAIVRMRDAKLSPELSYAIIDQIDECPVEILRSCSRSFDRGYRATPLTKAAQDQRWTYN